MTVIHYRIIFTLYQMVAALTLEKLVESSRVSQGVNDGSASLR